MRNTDFEKFPDRKSYTKHPVDIWHRLKNRIRLRLDVQGYTFRKIPRQETQHQSSVVNQGVLVQSESTARNHTTSKVQSKQTVPSKQTVRFG